jgi:hypothetical protein
MYKLTIELVPKPLWGQNLRTDLGPDRWDHVRTQVYKNAGYRCEICGGRGPAHPVECHEVWDYSVPGIQRLERMVALCPACHSVKHWGRTEATCSDKELKYYVKHFCTVNQVNIVELKQYIRESFAWWNRANKVAWKTDYGALDKYP